MTDPRDARIAQLEALVAKLMARVAELEGRLRRSSSNSSQPPSTDRRDAPRPAKGSSAGRKPGGQPGHEGSQRELLPPDKVDSVEDHWPEQCENCHRDLPQSRRRVEVGEPVRHQVTELPPLRPTVAEHRRHAQYCEDCAHTTLAELPPTVPDGAFGPRLQALMAVLSGVFRLSKRNVQGLLRDVFQVEVSLGAIITSEARTSAALAPAVAEAHAYVQDQSSVNADETGWWERSRRAWLWVAVTPMVTVFLINARRGADAARKLLGRFAGILSTDRWCAYASHVLRKRQICWAHLRRHFESFAENKGDAGVFGGALSASTDTLFQWWHRVRDGTMARSTFQAKVRKFRNGFEDLLRLGSTCAEPRMAATCREILAMAPALWTFVRKAGIEPTNNAAERALRPAVILRKTSFGTQSEHGSRFTERMLSVAATLKQQDRGILEYVTEACERATDGRRPRSLLPGARVMSAHALSQTRVAA